MENGSYYNIIFKGVFWDYIGIMEKKMETTKGIGVIGIYWGWRYSCSNGRTLSRSIYLPAQDLSLLQDLLHIDGRLLLLSLWSVGTFIKT